VIKLKISAIQKIIKEKISHEVQIENARNEGPFLAIYTPNPEIFYKNKIIGDIASKFRQRVYVRGDENSRSSIRDLLQNIENLVSDLGKVRVDAEEGTVEIETGEPQPKDTLLKIIEETKWVPRFVWKVESKIIEKIRDVPYKYQKERMKFLIELGKKIYSKEIIRNKWVRIHCLGGAREVGRSCFLVETPDSKIIFDLGVNVSNNQFPELSMSRIPINEIDAIVISHAHLDHCGAVPLIYKLGYSGPTYCTYPTRDFMALLQYDYIEVTKKDGKEPLYSEKDIENMLYHTIPLNYKEVTNITPESRITLFNAGHILGSALVHLHIGQGYHNILYTGDIKFGSTELLPPAHTTFQRMETLIVESTYGGVDDIQPNREETEKEFIKTINKVLRRGGNILIPVFAVGRAQEIMLIIEKYYKDKKLKRLNKVYIDGMVKDASILHEAYPEYLKKELKERILAKDSPFKCEIFEEVTNISRQEICESKRNIIIAPSGSLTGGPSLEYFRYLAENKKNAIFLVGYQFEGSIGKKLQNGIREFPIEEKGKLKTLKVECDVVVFKGFSGHADRKQLERFVKSLKPAPHRILVVHGESKKAIEFARDLRRLLRTESYAPWVLDVIRLA
jgi:KH/beta-lactamase-domain protein